MGKTVKKPLEKNTCILYMCMIGYMACVVYITMLSRTPSLSHMIRTTPFWSWSAFFQGNRGSGVGILLNVVLFIPIGYLCENVCRSKRISVILCILISLSIESLQYVTYLGFFDVDDIINNSLGGAMGVIICNLFEKTLEHRIDLATIIVAGVCGCVITPRNVQIYITQFNFVIENVIVQDDSLTVLGTCCVYNRESLEYDIILRDDKESYSTLTHTEGTSFVSQIDISPQNCYEIYVRFRGYEPINTHTYIDHGEVKYVKNAPTPNVSNTELEKVINEGELKCYQPDYDTYVYQVDDKLYWLIGESFDASLILHIYSENPTNLPSDRRMYGFDNKSFVCDSKNNITADINCDRYTVFREYLPDNYNISAVKVGMNRGKKVLWEDYFRVNNEFTRETHHE